MRRAFAVALTLALYSCGSSDPEPAATVDVGGAGSEDVGGSEGSEDLGPTPGSGADTSAPDGGEAPDGEAEEPDTLGSDEVSEGEDVAPPKPDVPPPANPCAGKVSGDACDDGDACTQGDVCHPDGCRGEAYTCSDGFGCTRDVCDGAGGCSFPILGDRCFIGGLCWHDGDPAPAGCQACVVPVSQTEWTADDSQGCDDGDVCSTMDVCFGGLCVPADYQDCDDDNICTDDGCTLGGGCTHAVNVRFCDDGDECTVGDKCKNGSCLPGSTFVTCDDGNSCTADGCFTGLGCVHENLQGACDDGSTCTVNDTCEKGVCIPGIPLGCADNNPCTDDLCHPKIGCITKFNEAPCNDGNPCTQGDSCVLGTCNVGPIEAVCTDGNPCTVDSCDISTGECRFDALNGVKCSDGDPCTLGDFCEAKKCKSGGQKTVCNDNNPCTDEKCGATGLCEFVPNVIACTDNDPCTVGDVCKGGTCESGTGTLNCADKNPCTDNFCQPGVGCINVANQATCFDGNECTTGDACLNGQCIPGSTGSACDDGNPCTDDACSVDKGCINTPNVNPCSDDEACTVGDQCQGGICVGVSSQCDDGNICTKEICLANGGCQHIPINSYECKPDIFIAYPPRGAMIYGPGPVIVTGWVKVKDQSSLTEFFINGISVPTNPNSGAFTYIMSPLVGMNTISTIATTALGGQDRGIRAFAWSTKYVAQGLTLPSGLGVWLSKLVWDDDNTSDVDDIATVMTLILESFDLASLIPNPLTKTSALHCTFTVKAQPVSIGNPQVDLVPINQALRATVRYPNLYVGLDVDASGFLCPSISGSVSANAVRVTIELAASTGPSGDVKFDIVNPDVKIEGLDVKINGILGFLFGWIIDLFEGTIADQIESQVLGQFSSLPLDLGEALSAIAITQEFELPALIGDAPPAKLLLSTSLTAADFDQFGGFFELGSAITATGGNPPPYTTLGSLARDKCGKLGQPDFFDYLMQNELEIALKDDLVNQMLHAAWRAGAFEIPLPKSMLPDADLSQYGVQMGDIDLSFLLPPILSSCNYDEKLLLGIGDMRVRATLKLFGQELTITAYASAVIEAEMEVVEDGATKTVGVALKDIGLFEVEVDNVSAGFEGAQGAVEELIGQFLGPDLFKSLGSSALGGIPIPEIPLDGFSDSIPSGTVLKLDLTHVYRLGGRTVLSGNTTTP